MNTVHQICRLGKDPFALRRHDDAFTSSPRHLDTNAQLLVFQRIHHLGDSRVAHAHDFGYLSPRYRYAAVPALRDDTQKDGLVHIQTCELRDGLIYVRNELVVDLVKSRQDVDEFVLRVISSRPRRSHRQIWGRKIEGNFSLWALVDFPHATYCRDLSPKRNYTELI